MSDPVLDALRDLVAALEENARQGERALRRAAEIERDRRSGLAYRDIVPAEERPLIIEVVTQNLQRLVDAGGRLRRAEAKALHDEGMTMDQIAELFGVTRQRISALLSEGKLETHEISGRTIDPRMDGSARVGRGGTPEANA